MVDLNWQDRRNMAEQKYITITGAREHNLKNIDVKICRNKFVVVTGPSGSGKSSLVFDTVYAEGQRRYVESLSTYARQFLGVQDKPDLDSITGLSPAIAIDQKTTSKNPRSTVSTITEIYDYLRLLYARIGVPYSPVTGLPITKQSASEIVATIKNFEEGTRLYILAPIVRGEAGTHVSCLTKIKKQGFERCIIDGELCEDGEFPALQKTKKHTIEVVVDRIKIDKELGTRLADSVEAALKLGEGLMFVQILQDEPVMQQITKPKTKKGQKLAEKQAEKEQNQYIVFSEHFACPESGFSLAELEPRIFSFNSPYGACKKCNGLGIEEFFDQELLIEYPLLSINGGAIPIIQTLFRGRDKIMLLAAIAQHFGFSLDSPYHELSENVRNIIFNGSKDEISVTYQGSYRSHKLLLHFPGIVEMTNDHCKNFGTEYLSRYKATRNCRSCGGYRLTRESLSVRINKRNIGELCALSIAEAVAWFQTLPSHLTETENKIGDKVIAEILNRLSFLQNVGLAYLTLSRASGTLSGGEAQRIRLASQIGSGLTGVMYILDEPSIGLHQSDNDKLIKTLTKLRDLGNSVIVVEHDEETMMAADQLIDIGPGAGIHGGYLVASGTPDEVSKDPASITGAYLSGRESIPVPKNRRLVRFDHKAKYLEVIGAKANNLKDVDVKIPLGVMTVVTGLSGGGKSSLVLHTLYKTLHHLINQAGTHYYNCVKINGVGNIDKIIEVDQSPIGRTPRSNPATYVGAFTPIRDWFTGLPESRMRGYQPGRFSFNVKGGRCEACQGDGMLKIEMHFLPDVYVKCDVCKGQRYNQETLEVRHKGKSIADILSLNIDDACEYFSAMPSIRDKLVTLKEVGLGYIELGQSATTLSGGEAQRIKLAKELSRRATGQTLYILDEPTTGLHSSDIKRLLDVLQKLTDCGNSVVIIEHQMDIIKSADWVIDIGPTGGIGGGSVVATGTPEEVANIEASITGQYLRKYLL